LGKEEYQHYHIINLGDEPTLSYVEGLFKKYSERLSINESDGTNYRNVFSEIDPFYRDNPNNLIIIDEIQASKTIYNCMRFMNRGLSSHLAVTGSYLGVVFNNRGYNEPVGDLSSRNMFALSYREYLKALGLYDEYSKINTFDFLDFEGGKEGRDYLFYKKIEDAFQVYLRIGGYPKVLTQYLASANDLQLAIDVLNDIVNGLYKEAFEYLKLDGAIKSVVNEPGWDKALGYIFKCLIDGSHNVLSGRDFRKVLEGETEIFSRDVMAILDWLSSSKIFDYLPVTDKLKLEAFYNNKSRIFAHDLGFLNSLKRYKFVSPTFFNGRLAENFVYLTIVRDEELSERCQNLLTYESGTDQIDFTFQTINRRLVGLEVKFGDGKTMSGDAALRAGRIDYLIRVTNTFGHIGDNMSTIPIFAFDKLGLILDRIESLPEGNLPRMKLDWE
jgi:predicted AAA+ superfamily ATPase